MPEDTVAAGWTGSVWELGVLLAGLGFFLLCVMLAFRLINKATATLKRVNSTLDKVDHEIGPILRNVNTTLDNVNGSLTQVEGELEKVGAITGNAAHISSNVANVTSLVVAAVGSPLVKAAAFGFGLRSAVKKRNQGVEEDQVRRMVEASRQSKRESKRAAKARKRVTQ
ncbi:DUF948 domain-containing protein [Glycomyces sp. TRM65418]|uniref:DUF948 domain-containing protein n=1 Tax=Glycomyces sp. TRM65418 TaxID=2867006 RepID=UPI001CE6FBC7|nr:DUF948 domain-containing protein [Glycomyces sp. TRM65418]MCC3764301.1 DUF948 domain-containing protein [Glycomyces sp. TRM65418]QZD53982.1 DUF948 domain-containing protein [Glycomyces sp. TRM65418]